MARTKQTARKAGSSASLVKKAAQAKQRNVPSVPAPPPKKARKYRRGTVALREIRRYQKTVDLLLPRQPFGKLVREIAWQTRPGSDLRWQANALDALQEATEAFIVGMFEDAQIAAVHGRRITIQPKDIHLIKRLRQDMQ